MTNLEIDRATYVPAGRPVARFGLALVILALLCGALWWSALAAPRLSIGNGSHGSYDPATGRATATVELRNTSPATVEIRAVSLGDGRLTIDSVSVGGRDLAGAGRRLAGGGTATMVISFTCRPEGDDRAPAPRWSPLTRLHVTVRTPIGLDRTPTAGRIPLFPACVR